jgi:hypothetical protein
MSVSRVVVHKGVHMSLFYFISTERLNGAQQNLSHYEGKLMLAVITSQLGYATI